MLCDVRVVERPHARRVRPLPSFQPHPVIICYTHLFFFPFAMNLPRLPYKLPALRLLLLLYRARCTVGPKHV